MVDWKLYIDSPQQRALDLCRGFLDEDDGDCIGNCAGAGWGDGYGYGNGNGCGRGYGGAAGDGWSEDKW